LLIVQFSAKKTQKEEEMKKGKKERQNRTMRNKGPALIGGYL
jgi:hypothetical protein